MSQKLSLMHSAQSVRQLVTEYNQGKLHGPNMVLRGAYIKSFDRTTSPDSENGARIKLSQFTNILECQL